MKANDQTIRKLMEGTSEEIWVLDTVGNCGEVAFKNVLTVVEPLSKNPGIVVLKPFGLRGHKKAIQLIEEERARIGLTTLE